MITNGQTTALYRFMEWIMRFAYLQFLWIACICLGLFVGGIFPSTTAMFAVARKWIRKETDVQIGPLFWKQYKSDFIKANAVGWLMLAAGFVLYFYMRFFQGNEGVTSLIMFVILVILIFLYCMTFIFIFPIFVHYRMSIFHLIRHATIFALAHPFHGITMVVFIALFILIITLLPGLLPFLSFSILAFSMMWIANLAFEKIDHATSR
ncbi:YesL family protein [Sutcliffiella sp. NPDC057660]|uniref:YesL family protein n=1 Tax=Sutcliffiella sp. NPDC057660 TaxID=3346199 RepID=UPI00369B627D